MPKVYVVQEMNKFDYSDTEKHGDLVFITDKEFRTTKASLVNSDIMASLHKFEDHFDPDTDFLVLTGSPIIMSYAFHLAIRKKGYVRLLRWDGHAGQYQEVRFKPEDFIN